MAEDRKLALVVDTRSTAGRDGAQAPSRKVSPFRPVLKWSLVVIGVVLAFPLLGVLFALFIPGFADGAQQLVAGSSLLAFIRGHQLQFALLRLGVLLGCWALWTWYMRRAAAARGWSAEQLAYASGQARWIFPLLIVADVLINLPGWLRLAA